MFNVSPGTVMKLLLEGNLSVKHLTGSSITTLFTLLSELSERFQENQDDSNAEVSNLVRIMRDVIVLILTSNEQVERYIWLYILRVLEFFKPEDVVYISQQARQIISGR